MHSLNQSTEPVCTEEAGRLLAQVCRLAGAGPVVIAVSGGPDSTALMGLYAEARPTAHLPDAIIATVDHGLRRESLTEAQEVGRRAAMLGLPHHLLQWQEKKPSTGIQEAAREARYRLLAGLARKVGAKTILVAHTLDDQAETILMRLMRGSGLKGLGGMEMTSLVHQVTLHRPFMVLPKTRLIATCADRQWPYVEDPANIHPSFLRARLRTIAPMLANEGLTAERLARLAMRMRRADDVLDDQALQVMENCRIWKRGATIYDATRLAAEPEEIVVRVFAHVIAVGRSADLHHKPLRLERIEALACDFQRAVADGLSFRRNAGGLLFTLRNGMLTLKAEPARKPKKVTTFAKSALPQLGKGIRDA